jgi:hypothetical protein
LNQWSRCFLTLARRRSVATNVFFVREVQIAQEPANRIRVRLNAGRIRQRTGQFGHSHVAVLVNQFDQKRAMRIELASGTALKCCMYLTSPPVR